MDGNEELFRKDDSDKEQRQKRTGLIVLGVITVFVVLSMMGNDTGSDAPRRPSSASAEDERYSRGACQHFRNVANNADVMTHAEIRQKMKEVHNDANIATPAVRSASRDALAAMTSGTTADFEAAITRLSAACSAAGW